MKKKELIESCVAINRPVLNENTGSRHWTADVWRLDIRNLNGRIYTSVLAERICSENIATIANDGHENWTSEYGDAKAVCKNPRIENGCLRVDIEFIDSEYENKLLQLMENGIAIGVSSVGYGEETENGTIVAETYELVRYLDFVTRPAGEVYAAFGENRAKGNNPKQPSNGMPELGSEELSERRGRLTKALSKYIIRR